MDSFESAISIIVPTHGRVDLVERLLRSLKEARTIYSGDTEILLVDSSNIEDRLKIQSLCEIWDAKLLYASNRVCLKRNVGIVESHFDTIFFIDSDCEADKNVLVKHNEFKKKLKYPAAILGFTDWTGPKTEIWKILDLISGFGSAFNFAKWFNAVPWGTCSNLMVEKSWLLKIGGFDESIPIRVFGDDVDLGIRLNKSGCKIICNPEAVVWHSRKPYRSFPKILSKYYLSGRADYHLGKRHSERLHREHPGPAVIFLLLLILAFGKVISGGSLWILVVPLIWGSIFLLVSSLLLIIAKKRELSSYTFQFLALLPVLSFEMGRIYESLINLNPGAIGMKFIYIKEQLVAEQSWRLIKLYLIIITLPPAIGLIFLL